MELKDIVRHKIDTKTKPPGSLGMLEEIALKIALIQGSESPVISKPTVIVFAGDHGIAQTGLVNPYPQSVTAQMVLNFLNGGAAINVFCKTNGLDLEIVDCGVNYEFDDQQKSKLIDAKVGFGTGNYLERKAMSEDEVRVCLLKGSKIVQAITEGGTNLLAFGEMGISNTSSASLIMSALMKKEIEDCVGIGTGLSDQQLSNKCRILKRVFSHHQLDEMSDVYQLMSAVGGYEIVMMSGAFLEAANRKMVILVDGFIATASLMLAMQIDPGVINNCIFSHCSGEKGHAEMLKWLGVKPLLDLGLRLGEGTGAALAYPIVKASVDFLNNMASFSSAGISNRS